MKTKDEIDMSPEAIAARLDSVRALYRLTRYLRAFKAVDTAAADGTEGSAPSADARPDPAGSAEREHPI